MYITQKFANATALNKEITKASMAAKEDCATTCGRGCIISRGAFIKAIDAKGNIIKGECDSWPYEGTKDQFTFLANLLRYDSNIAELSIEGGFDWAANPRDYADGEYEPWASEWAITFGYVTTEAQVQAGAAV